MNPIKSVSVLSVLLAASAAYSGSLFAPFSVDSAGVMPKGVRNVRVLGFTTELDDKFNGAGGVIPLGDAFNQTVTWGKLVDAQPPGFDRGQFKGGLESLGTDLESAVGIAQGLVNARVTVTSPVLAYGVSEKFTLGLAVPVYYTNVNVSTGWTANESFQAKLDELSQKGYFNKVLSVEQKLMNVVNAKIAANGYKPLANESRHEIGDLTLAGKYLLYKSDDLAAVLSPKLVLPTGRTADIDRVVDIAPGDGQLDVGLGATLEYTAAPRVALTSSVSYLHQLPTTKAKRVPYSSDENLTPDVDDNVFEKLGDQASLGLGAKFKLHELLTFGTGYSLQYKQADLYSGSKYSGARYDYMEEDTEQLMHAAIAGLNFSTIPLFRAGKFAAPLEASLNFASVISGRNVNKINLTSFELAAYF